MRLVDSHAKLGRAQYHFDTLKAEIDAFIQTKRYRLVVDKPTDHLCIVRLDTTPVIPAERWGLLVGDCIHNLRSALDYTAWQLAGGDTADTHTQFPIFETREEWQSKGVSRIRRLKPEARALIKRMQPFHSATPRDALLNVIRILDNTDKHMLIPVVAAAPRSFRIDVVADSSAIVPQPTFIRPPVLSGNAVLATLENSNAANDAKVEPYLTIFIAFGESLFPVPVHLIYSINNMFIDVKDVIDAFERRPELFHE